MKKILSILFFVFIAYSGFAQFDFTHDEKFENISIVNDGKNIIVIYDLITSENNRNYYVDVNFYNSKNDDIIDAKTLSGDVGIVTPGVQKKLFWNYKKDSVFLNQKIYVKFTGQPQADIQAWKHIGKSVIFPGWGDQKLRSSILPFGFGVVGYGSIGASIYFNQKAGNAYQSYLNTTDPEQVDNLFQNAKTYNNLSWTFAGIAATAWIIDIAGVIIRQQRLKNHSIELESNFYYDKAIDDRIIAQSSSKYINTRESITPPYITIPKTQIKLVDADDNKTINANEKAVIEFQLTNIGKGTGTNLYADVSTDKKIKGLQFPEKHPIGSLKPEEEKTVSIPLYADVNIPTTDVKFTIEVKEGMEFDPKPFEMTVSLSEFLEPEVVIADHKFTVQGGGRAERGKIINLQVIVQNIGQGMAEDVSASFIIPDKVAEIDNRVLYIDTLQPNEKNIFNYRFVPKTSYPNENVPVRVKLDESFGEYAKVDNEFMLHLNDKLESTKLVVESLQEEKEISKASFSSDIDKNIPENRKENDDLYVLIIGNEDYHSYQKDLNSEVDVAYAANDARTFYEYSLKTLGALEKNIEILENATAGQMNTMITKYNTLTQYMGEDAEFVFYYAGHGLPDEVTKEPYLIPVDVSGNNLENAIKLNDVYHKLTEYPTRKVTVILDACFSGGARNKGLLATRGIKVEPEKGELQGNIVVFSSSSGNQSSSAYDDKFHGLFTYYFLKKLQETEGNVSYKEMEDYLKSTVKKESLLINDKIQTPNLQYSREIKNKWEKWNFVK